MGNQGKEKKSIKLVDVIVFIILICALIIAYKFYQKNNFNEFVRSEAKPYTSVFVRDSEEKYSKRASYKIESSEYNDAMFYKSVKVQKNKPYKVTCMVKTKDIQAKEKNSGIGAQISIEGTTERSMAISGTNDWQKIEMIFNAKDRDVVNIGFRLGGYLGEAKGISWFSDFTLEEGLEDTDNEWKFACFIFDATDVTINGKEVKLNVVQSDIDDITDTISRFQKTCSELSDGKMKANCKVYKTKAPITSLSYDEEFGYFAAPEDVEGQIKSVIEGNDFDHIFIILRLGDEEHQDDIQVNDWIGLGSMDYYGIGYSNIRLPNSSKSYVYRYDTRINTFPEEVFLHEFLHSLERTAEEYGYERPELHDYEKYGYRNEALIGQKRWYTDYMNKNINSSSGKIGLPKEVYNLKPAKENNFEYPYKINEFKQPENVIEGIIELFRNLVGKVKYLLQR